MVRILYKYFIINRKLCLPGIGVLTIRRQPATLDYVRKAFITPTATVEFVAGDAVADEKFYFFIGLEQEVEVATAVDNFNHYVNRLAGKLQAGGRVELPGIGSFSKKGIGPLRFTPGLQVPPYFQNISIETTDSSTLEEAPHVDTPVKRRGNRKAGIDVQEETGKSYWWVYAVILALLSIAGIVYYYTINGRLM